MLKIKGATLPRVRTESRSLECVDPARVADALGAESIERPRLRPQGPVALLALRQGLAERLQSTGGRPGLGEDRRQKIPLSDADWTLRCELSAALATDDRRPTPGQVASELLHQRLRELHEQLSREAGAPTRARST